MRKILSLFAVVVGWRVWLAVLVVAGALRLPYRPEMEFTRLNFYGQVDGVASTAAWLPWANFDGVHYLQIAKDGYSTNWRFFPLFPLLIKGLAGGSTSVEIYFWVGLVISSLALVAGLVGLQRLVALDTSEDTFTAIALLLCFPTAFFLSSIYTESLFLCLAVWMIWAARTGRFALATVLVSLLGVTRLTGALLLLVLWWEIWQATGLIQRQKWAKGALSCVALLPFFLWVWSNWYFTGDALRFLKGHAELGNSREVTSLVLPPQTIYRYARLLSTVPHTEYEWWVATIELGVFLWAVVVWLHGWRQGQRGSYLLLTALVAGVPIFSGTFTGLPRYVLPAFPLFLSMAGWPKVWRWGYMAGGVVLGALLCVLFARGYFVG